MELGVFVFLIVGVPLIIRFFLWRKKRNQQKERDRDLHDIAEYARYLAENDQPPKE